MIETKRAMVDAFETSQRYKLVFRKELHEIEVPLLQRKIETLKNDLNSEEFHEG